MVPDVTPTDDARVPCVVDSREELRRKISAFNNNSQGYIMSLASPLFSSGMSSTLEIKKGKGAYSC